MGVEGHPQIIERRLAQFAMRSPEVPFGDIGRSATVHLFEVDKCIQVRGVRPEPKMHHRMSCDLHLSLQGRSGIG